MSAHRNMQGVFARVFAEGCDARLSGKPRSACPWNSCSQKDLWKLWMQGWEDIEANWGIRLDQHELYEVKALRPVSA